MSNRTSNKVQLDKSSFIWNIIGSMLGAASSFVLLLCVTRTVGVVEGGIFSIAFATAQILLTAGKFGVRSYQATDVRDEISFGTYLTNRILTCLLMLLLAVIYIVLAGYNLRKALIFIFVVIIKMVDAIEDVFHGQLQKTGHLDVAGKLLSFRNLMTILCFAAAMYLLRDLLWGSVVTAAVSLVLGTVVNIIVSRRYLSITFEWDMPAEMELVRACVPLFVGHFLSIYIYNAPKYSLDFFGTQDEIAIYSIIFMPAFVINLFSEFVFKPLLTMIAHDWNEHLYRKFMSLVAKLIVNILGITIVVMAGAYFVGAQLLSIVYAVDVVAYRMELVLLMLSGGFSAAVYLLYNVLTSMRKQKIIIANYAVVTVMITMLAYVGVYNWGIFGGTVSYLISEVILFLLMLSGMILEYKKESRKYEDRDYNISGNE